MEIEWLLSYAVLGVFSGFASGLLGVGGGGILVPILTMMFAKQGFGEQYAMHLALGTALMCMAIAGVSSARAHAKRQSVHWQAVKGMSVGIVMGSILFTQLAPAFPATLIAVIFSVFMALTALHLFSNWQPPHSSGVVSMAQLVVVGFGIGALSALVAVGGGFLMVLYLSYKRVPMTTAIGTSAAVVLPIAITGSVGYMISGTTHSVPIEYTLGFVYLPAVVIIAISSSIAATLGASVSHSLSEKHLKRLFALLCLALSLTMLMSLM